MVVDAQQEFTFNCFEGLGQAVVVGSVEGYLVADGGQVRRVAVEQAVGSIITSDAVGEVEVFDRDAVEPAAATTDGREDGAAKTAAAAEGIAKVGGDFAAAAEGGLDDVPGAGGLLDVGEAGLGLIISEVLTAVKLELQLIDEGSRMAADDAEQVGQLGVAVVEDFSFGGGLGEEQVGGT